MLYAVVVLSSINIYELRAENPMNFWICIAFSTPLKSLKSAFRFETSRTEEKEAIEIHRNIFPGYFMGMRLKINESSIPWRSIWSETPHA